ncbi:MAG TPA: hypothetical protein VJ044_15290, partial [Candidatus Hodarchaeales archaeon]|nr:hypothetical protein [Candidatus Hodarchaeales archaeon]
ITKNRFLRDFIEGFSFIVSTKGLLAILVIATTYNTLLGPIYHTLIPVFVTDYNNGNSTHLALVFSSFQLGVLITSIVLTTKDIIKNKPLGMLAGSLMSCIGLIALVFSPTGDWLISSAVAMFVAGCSFSVVVICSQTIWQHAVPMEKLGRVLSARIFLARSLMPIGSLLVGAIAEVIGIVPVFGILPTIAILAVLGIYSLGNVGEIRVQKQPAL